MLFYEISDGMRGTLYRGRKQLWVSCHLRKKFRCRKCGMCMIAHELAYRPITNADNRMWRVHPHCMTLVPYSQK